MDSNDLLIITPTRLSFRLPFPHVQKRLVSLLNASGQTLVYQVQASNERSYKVQPSCGRIGPFDTIELRILLHPTKELELASSCFTFKCVAVSVDSVLPDDWADHVRVLASSVSVSVDNDMDQSDQRKVRQSLQLQSEGSEAKNLMKAIEQKYRERCVKRLETETSPSTPSSEGRSWCKDVLCPAMIVLFGGTAAAFYHKERIANALGLVTEPIY